LKSGFRKQWPRSCRKRRFAGDQRTTRRQAVTAVPYLHQSPSAGSSRPVLERCPRVNERGTALGDLLVPALLTCGPALFATAALWETTLRRKEQLSGAASVWTVGSVWLITVYAAYVFIRYTLFPPAGSPPPWTDPETLDLAMLFLLAPIGMAAAIAAGKSGASRRTVIALIASLFVLFAVGCMEGMSV
jgi:hypothetical protein